MTNLSTLSVTSVQLSAKFRGCRQAMERWTIWTLWTRWTLWTTTPARPPSILSILSILSIAACRNNNVQRVTGYLPLVSSHSLDNTPSFVFAMSHPYRVQFRRDTPPGAARAFSAACPGLVCGAPSGHSAASRPRCQAAPGASSPSRATGIQPAASTSSRQMGIFAP
jgi:hypothetical protein